MLHRFIHCLYILFLTLMVLAPAHTLHAKEPWIQIKWEALIPKDWDPAKEFKALDLSRLHDNDPRATDALSKLKNLWENAPGEPSMNGRKIRIAGYALPLENSANKVTEFLIVPYYGACVHTPPPPANQIIHAKSFKPLSGVKMMAPIWTYGTLNLHKESTQWGVAGYRLTVERIEPFQQEVY